MIGVKLMKKMELSEFAYKCTDFYDPSSEAGIKWDDPTIGVKWPIPEGTTPNISEKERFPLYGLPEPMYPAYREVRTNVRM